MHQQNHSAAPGRTPPCTQHHAWAVWLLLSKVGLGWAQQTPPAPQALEDKGKGTAKWAAMPLDRVDGAAAEYL